MLRKSLPLFVVAALVCAAAPVEAQSKAKAKKKDATKTLNVGDEVILHIVGDEAMKRPGLTKAGITSLESLVLPVYSQPDFRVSNVYTRQDDRAAELFGASAQIGDKGGIDQLLAQGSAVRLVPGTKLLVLSRRPGMTASYTQLPVTPGGDCRARVLEGPDTGKIVEVPVRNLREPPPPSTPTQKP